MSRIHDEYLDCVFYLYPDEESAKHGHPGGGCGFLVSVPFESRTDKLFLYAVTNRHVIEKTGGGCPFIRFNTKGGGAKVYHLAWHNWTCHKCNDVAVVNIVLDPNEFIFKCVGRSDFITQDLIKEYGIGPGDDVFLVGRLITSGGRQRNTPSARFGNISLMPIEPVNHETLGEVEAFQCELKSISGFSGSPVFVRPSDQRADGSIHIGAGIGPWLLGVDWGHSFDREYLNKDGKTSKTEFVRRNTGITSVAPAWAIRDLLDYPELKAQRKEDEAKEAK